MPPSVPIRAGSARLAAWLGIAAYTIQIYFDFSGYSDMAIGLGSMFGFTFPENFRRPYSAVSITDFWRRWHITLSNWFRDYLYIPLGGSRRSPGRTMANLWIVFVLVGIWHGANWTFLLWGIYHGAWLVAERLTGQRPVGDGASLAPLRRAVTLLAVMVGWVMFRSPTAGHAFSYLGAMFSAGGITPQALINALDTRALLALALGGRLGAPPRQRRRWPAGNPLAGRKGHTVRIAEVAVALPICDDHRRQRLLQPLPLLPVLMKASPSCVAPLRSSQREDEMTATPCKRGEVQ